MSMRNLRLWESGDHTHTALDDCESFIWVIIIVAIEIWLKRGNEDPLGAAFLRDVCATKFKNIAQAKSQFHSDVDDAINFGEGASAALPDAVIPVLPLVGALFKVIRRYTFQVFQLTNAGASGNDASVQSVVEAAYAQFIQVGLAEFDKLGATWE